MSSGEKSLYGLSVGAKNELLERMRRRRAMSEDGGSLEAGKRDEPALDSSTNERDDACRFDRYPGYRQLMMLKAAAERLEISNPYYRMHDGIAGSTTVIEGREYINYASYNYLGLCGHPEVSRAAIDAIESHGTSVSASRPVSGERAVQRMLELTLATMHGVDDCVVLVSGHATNVTTLGHLFGARDLIVHDALIHNSIVQGALLSGARRIPFPHNDWDGLDSLLRKHRAEFERAVIVLEGLYSMDGDIPDLQRAIEIKRRHRAFLMIDEAHSIGVLGEHGYGIGEHFGIEGEYVDIWMGTLSKTLASSGGYIAGCQALVDYLKASLPGFMYSVGLSPPTSAAALAAIEVMKREPSRVETLRKRGALFLRLARDARLNTGNSIGYSVIPVIVGSSAAAARISNALFERGINVQPIIHPAVEEQAARLRFFMSCKHTEQQIRDTVSALTEVLDEASEVRTLTSLNQ